MFNFSKVLSETAVEVLPLTSISPFSLIVTVPFLTLAAKSCLDITPSKDPGAPKGAIESNRFSIDLSICSSRVSKSIAAILNALRYFDSISAAKAFLYLESSVSPIEASILDTKPSLGVYFAAKSLMSFLRLIVFSILDFTSSTTSDTDIPLVCSANVLLRS